MSKINPRKKSKIKISIQANIQEPVSKHTFVKNDLLCLITILIYCLFVWWPTKNFPYHWDSAGFIINTTRDLLASNFKPFVGTDMAYAHPVLFPFLLGNIWRIFGASIIVSHIFMFIFLPILLISTYYISKKYTQNYIGLLTALIVGFVPVVLTEYGMIYIDLPMAALTTLAFSLWMYNKKYWASIIISLAILIKLPAVLLIPIFVLDIWLKDENKYKLKKIKYLEFTPILIPSAILIIWLTYHYSINHWLLVRPDIAARGASLTIKGYLQNLKYVTNITLIDQNRWLISITGLISAIYLQYLKKLKEVFNSFPIVLISLLTLSILFFSSMMEFGSRYSIFLLPILTSLSFYLLSKATNNNKYIHISIGLIIMLMMVTIWHPKIETTKYEFQPKNDLSYQDLIKIGQQSAQFVSINYENAEIYGDFPEVYQLTQTYQGYVKQSLNFKKCIDFKQNNNIPQIIYVHAYSPGQQICRQLIEIIPSQPIKRFESNGKWIELYQVESTNSAQILQTPQLP